jgi:hypothetical protein
MDELDTGDIILFSSDSGCFDRVIRRCSGSIYTHVGIIIKNPVGEREGIYMLESGTEPLPDVETGKEVFGVQLQHLENVADRKGVFYRKLHLDKSRDLTKPLCAIDHLVHGRPYDVNPLDWLKAELRVLDEDIVWEQQTSSFWCSALAAFIYVKLGLLGQNVPWSLVSPKEWGSEQSETLKFLGCHLDKEVVLRL